MSSSPDTQEATPLVKQALLAVEQMKARLAAIERKQREPIAVVGLSCRFPGWAATPAAFWQLLRSGKDAVTRIPEARWNVAAYYDPNPNAPGKAYTPYGAFIEDIDLFDAQFFSIAPVEATSMDPQQRLLLEVSWEALENGGIAASRLRGSRTGVFVGICASDYMMYTLGSRAAGRIDALAGTGAAASVAAGRLSYFYGFHGPTFPVDTACSSSLLAFHLACKSLRHEECDLALAAGVSAMLSPEVHVYFAKTRALSPQRHCRAFDAGADGYVRGEGCGVVVLKRLSDALADGDNVLAIVRGSAVNHDGRSSGLTAPNGPAQQAVIRQALADGNVSPGDVGYVETHGTGTPLGDPIELQALAAVLAENRAPERPVWIGSVKTNIGHLEGAAGIASLIKTVLMLHHKELVPHLHFERPNPHVPWSQLPVKVVTTHQPWPATGPRIAGVSSFGFSGTNVHVVLAEAPPLSTLHSPLSTSLHAAAGAPYLLPLAAKSAGSLRELAGRYAAHLQAHPEQSLADVCHTAAAGRSHFAHRLAVVAESSTQLQEKLAAFHDEASPAAGVQPGHHRRHTPPAVVFQFTGQGAQYPGMGQRLYQREPVFREALVHCDALLRPYLPRPLLAVLYPDQEGDRALLHETLYTQPALFAFEYALAKLWQSWGIEPAAVTGHSVGEYVAACLAGVFSLADALRLVAARGRLMQTLPQNGAMLVAFAGEAEVAPFLEQADLVTVAAVNGPDNVVISGEQEAVATVAGQLDAAGVITRSLRVSHAFHSPLMEPILDEFRETAAQITFAPPQIPLVSNVTGRFFAGGEVPGAAYWARHVRQPVYYFAGLQRLIQEGYRLFLEVGPKPILSDLGRRYVPQAGHWLPSCDESDEEALILRSLATCYVNGCAVAWEQLYPGRRYRRVALPTYPFERKRFWIESEETRAAAVDPVQTAAPADSLLNAFVDVLE